MAVGWLPVRNGDDEAAAAAFAGAVGVQVASVALGDGACEEESEAEAALRLAEGWLKLDERLEDALQLVLGQSDTGVLDGHRRAAHAIPAGGHVHLAPGGREAQRVGEQVVEKLPKQQGVRAEA